LNPREQSEDAACVDEDDPFTEGARIPGKLLHHSKEGLPRVNRLENDSFRPGHFGEKGKFFRP
jgi:hypothetical protein